MNLIELSDLEEGEILEYESVSPCDSKINHYGIKPFESPVYGNKKRRLKDNQGFYLSELGKHGHISVREKSNVVTVDLESISSEGELKSDEEKHSADESRGYAYKNGERKMKRRETYGTVEDIMSEIGETISRCNYKRRKSKDFDKHPDTSYDAWRRKVFSSHIKIKKRKRKLSFSDSGSEVDKSRVEKSRAEKSRAEKSRAEKRRKRKRKREVCYAGETKPKMRDFDEVRRNLLEKLKKQKIEEESKAKEVRISEELKDMENCSLVENTEIQEVDMLVDCTNYVDKAVEEKEGEEELDLIKLRLIALTSNKKPREITPKTEEKPLKNSREDVDLDRNELLLRAEALKTALLKKHEKRLNRLKGKKQSEVRSSGDDGSPLKKSEGSLDLCPWKENVQNKKCEAPAESSVPLHGVSGLEMKVNGKNDAGVVANMVSGKVHQRARVKRKKRRSGSFSSNLKENTDKSEAFEEDDRTLRSQLLIDLMKKKSLKDPEKKSVLIDAIQSSANKPYMIEPSKEVAKPSLVVKKSLMKKVNELRTVRAMTSLKSVKYVTAPKIPKPEIQRIVVHLGSEDSSDEDGGSRVCPGFNTEVVQTSPLQEDDRKGQPEKLTDSSVQADYEKSVELLLSEARRKIEGEKRNTTKSSLTTPEAVYKHLPPSQRLEYIRLKQKIAEREKLKKEKNENSGISSSSRCGPQPSDTSKLSSATFDVQTNLVESKAGVVNLMPTRNGPKTKLTNQGLAINRVKNGSSAFYGPKPPTLLLPSSQALISKLKLLLKKIKIEKTIEENYEKEIVKLKTQLSLLEKKKTEQRFKIRKLGEESMKTYKAIQDITAKSEEKKKDVPEEKPKDVEKKPEEEGKNVSNEPETEITEAKTEKEVNDDKTNEVLAVVSSLEYHSPFLSSSQVSGKVDPNVMICQFDLTGVCKDEECCYQHLPTS